MLRLGFVSAALTLLILGRMGNGDRSRAGIFRGINCDFTNGNCWFSILPPGIGS